MTRQQAKLSVLPTLRPFRCTGGIFEDLQRMYALAYERATERVLFEALTSQNIQDREGVIRYEPWRTCPRVKVPTFTPTQ